jgi:lysophospholipase L1-like esterase
MRQGDPDSEVNFFRQIEDRMRKLEARSVEQPRTSVKELRLRGQKRLSSMMVIGDSISQFDRCNQFVPSLGWVKQDNSTQYRWQDRVSDSLAGTSGLTRIAPTQIGPFSDTSLVGTPKMEVIGTGPFVHWDYSIPGAWSTWWLEQALPKYAPPAEPVDLLCVLLGANDYYVGTDPEAYQHAIATILNEYPHNYACVTVPWQNGIVNPETAAFPWSEYVTALESLSSAKVVVVEPVAGVPDASLAADLLHPTQDGHNLIASSVLTAVSTLDKAPAAQVSITASRMGAVVDGGIVIGNWRISVNEAGQLVGTNILTNQSTVLAS